MNLFNININLGDFVFWKRKKSAILVVDDDPSVIYMISESAKDFDIEVMAATTAEQAIGILSTNGRKFLHILIDVGLPGVNGWQLREQITARWTAVPVTMMSAASDRLTALPVGQVVGVYLKSPVYSEFFRRLK